MELRQLRYFIAVAEEGSFSHAAQRLSISQPPITRQIHQLEEELGVQLFKRTPKGAKTTEAGKIFLTDAREVLATLARSQERVQAAYRGELGTLAVGYFGSPSYRLVPEIVASFREDHPDVDVSLKRLSKAEQIQQLQSGAIHIGFGRYYPEIPGLSVQEILREDLMLAYPSSKPPPTSGRPVDWLSSRGMVLFPAKGRPNFADDTLRKLSGMGVRAEIAVECEDVRSAMIQVATGVGFCLVPQSVAEVNWSGVSFRKIGELSGACPASCIYRRSDTSPILRSMRQTISAYLREEQEN